MPYHIAPGIELPAIFSLVSIRIGLDDDSTEEALLVLPPFALPLFILMDLTERLFGHIARSVTGSDVVEYQGQSINLGPGWARLTFHESLEKVGGIDPEIYRDFDAAKALVEKSGEKVLKGEKLGKVQAKLFDIFVEPKLIQPHFIYKYPTDISPLSRRNTEQPELTDRFELFITGREMGNAFSELNDPVDQRLRFEEQVREKEAGDDEAHRMIDSFAWYQPI